MIPKWLRKYGYKNDYIYNVICNQDNVKELTGKSGFDSKYVILQIHIIAAVNVRIRQDLFYLLDM